MAAAPPAWAEVCDKVRPHWDPASGPVSQVDDLLHFLTEPLGLGTIALVAISLAFRRAWLAIATTIVLIAVAALLFFDIANIVDDITHEARLEGCLTQPVLVPLILLGIGLIVIWWPRRPAT